MNRRGSARGSGRSICHERPPGPSEGIFYVVRFPRGWESVALRFDQGQEVGHPEFWREQIVPRIAREWSRVLNRAARALETELRMLEYGFPRGRVVRQATRFTVFNGNDLGRFMKVTKAAIEGRFGIIGLARWQEDDHEHCLREDKEAVRQLLHLREDWKHASVD
jgi:hypothetical protein